jgi:hypothetical protein
LAAIGGVLLMAVLPFSSAAVGPTLPPAPQAQGPELGKAAAPEQGKTTASEQGQAGPGAGDRPASEQIPPLKYIFNLDNNIMGLVVAAVFGLTPGLLFEQIQKQAEKYKTDLRSSEAIVGTTQKT